MNATEIAKALGGRRDGNGWIAPCPAHDDHHPSLSLSEAKDGKTLFKCFAGCSQTAVVAALQARGLWGRKGEHLGHIKVTTPTKSDQFDVMARRKKALSIWDASRPALGSLVETYLSSRKLALPSSSSIRFNPYLRHLDGRSWPAMITLATGLTGEPIGIHRTYLDVDGTRKAPVPKPKLALGACSGGAARLAVAETMVMVGEGIESCLSAMQAVGKPAWAALSAPGLRALQLPPAIREVIILADGDDAGEAAACHAALRWCREGRQVRIARPPRGKDFNDLLIGDVETQETI